MLNHSKQQQSVILKGIAQQILTMQMPTFEEANKLFIHFGLSIQTVKEQLKDNILSELASRVEGTTFFCFQIDLPTGMVIYHVEELSWDTRSPEAIERLVEISYMQEARTIVWDPKLAQLWREGKVEEFDKLIEINA